MIGIYKITSPSGKIYIGQSNNVEKRLKGYLKEYKCMSSQKRLYNSFLKYGSENHIFEIIDECTIELLNERERFWQEYYNSIGLKGLNCILTQTSEKKRVLSNETRIKLSKSLKGKLSGEKNPMYGKFGSLNHFYGKKHTEETKKILKEKNSGVNHVFYGKKRPEHSVKMSGKNHYMYGKKNTILSEYNKINKIGNKNMLGKKHTEETKKRIGLKNSGSNHVFYVKKRPEHSEKLKGVKKEGKLVLDLNTGIFYISLKELCDLNGYKYETMYARLIGINKNNTNFIFV
jgi:group I intron endonuclease